MDVSLLKTIPLFAEVPDEQLRKIAPFATTDEFAEGEVVVKEGGYSNHFFAIEEGTAKVERDGEHLADLGPGDVFGEQGLLEKQERVGDGDRHLAAAGDQDRALGALPDAASRCPRSSRSSSARSRSATANGSAGVRFSPGPERRRD